MKTKYTLHRKAAISFLPIFYFSKPSNLMITNTHQAFSSLSSLYFHFLSIIDTNPATFHSLLPAGRYLTFSSSFSFSNRDIFNCFVLISFFDAFNLSFTSSFGLICFIYFSAFHSQSMLPLHQHLNHHQLY